tara:strand:+ start:15 stop:539 length:525 start_codon:yes stop_codon:yes gene_type:complete
MADPKKLSLNVAILTVSDSRTLSEDTSGEFLQSSIDQSQHLLCDRKLCKDDVYEIRNFVSSWIASPEINVVISNGGTGVTGKDGTPEAILPLADKILDGFGEIFRFLSYDEIGTSSIQSRAFLAVANRTYIFVLPGSTGACQLAWEKLIKKQLDSGTEPCNLADLVPRLGDLDK